MSSPSPSPSPAAPPADGIIAPELPAPPSPLRAAITAAWLRDETEHVRELLEQARLPAAEQAQAQKLAVDLVKRVRARAQDQGAIEAFMRQYDLGSEEGVLLMCVAEALLRIPDQDTADEIGSDELHLLLLVIGQAGLSEQALDAAGFVTQPAIGDGLAQCRAAAGQGGSKRRLAHA